MHSKLRLYHQNCKCLWVPALICGFCILNSNFSIRITSLYGCQPLFVAFACKTDTFWTRINSLYWSQTSPVVLCMQNSVISTRINCLQGSRPSSVVYAFKIGTIAAELQVSLGPSPHQWFLHAKQRLLDQNYNTPRVPDLTYDFQYSKQRL